MADGSINIRRDLFTIPSHQADAANIILQSIYVDDCIMEADSEQDAVSIRKQLNELLSRTCMVLRKWLNASNAAFGGVLAKTKVAKLSSPNTTPRLKLCAALLLSQLLRKVAVVLDVSPDCVFAWSDSTITMNWINIPP